MKRVVKTGWVWALLFSQISQAAPISERARLGVMKLGETQNAQEEKAYEIVETRLRRWLENLRDVRPEVRKLKASLRAESMRTALAGARLKTLSDRLIETAIKGSAPEDGVLEEARTLRANLVEKLELGPILQRAYFAEALALWRIGEKKASGPLIRQTALLHPDGALEPMEALTETEIGNDPALSLFEANAVGATSKLNRQCSVEVEGLDASQTLTVNGFDFGPRRNFQLLVGGTYLFQLGKWSDQRRNGKIVCDRSGRRRLTFPATPNDEAKIRYAAGATEPSGEPRTMALIEPRGGEFLFYLYTPGLGLDPIPTHKRVLVAEVLGDSGQDGLPLRNDAMRGLFEKHQVGMLQMESNERPWYNSPTFWAVAGGVVAAGAIATYFVTRRSSVQSQSSGGLTIHWE